MTERLEKIPVKLRSDTGNEKSGELEIQIRDKSARQARAMKLTLRNFKMILPLPICAIFVHVLAIPTLLLFTAAFLSSPFFYRYFFEQKTTFSKAEGECPYCGNQGRLESYVWTTLNDKIALLCPKCGQVSSGVIEGKIPIID